MSIGTVEIPGYIAGSWRIDPAHSHVGFVVRHLMISKVRGYFTRFEGEIVTAGDPLASSVTAVVDVASVDTGNAQRDEHLRNPDFFDVERYPSMSFRSTTLRRDGDDFILDGELGLHGVTRPVRLRLEVNGFGPDPFAADPATGARVGFTATGEIDRTDFGITYGGPVPGGDVGLGHKVRIELEIQAALVVDA